MDSRVGARGSGQAAGAQCFLDTKQAVAEPPSRLLHLRAWLVGLSVPRGLTQWPGFPRSSCLSPRQQLTADHRPPLPRRPGLGPDGRLAPDTQCCGRSSCPPFLQPPQPLCPGGRAPWVRPPGLWEGVQGQSLPGDRGTGRTASVFLGPEARVGGCSEVFRGSTEPG